jgi:hypothetical protein
MRLKTAAILAFAALTAAAVMATTTPARAQQPSLFEILIPATSLNMRGNLTVPGRSESPALREFLGYLTVRANGAVCLTVNLTSSNSDVLVQLGLQGQASPCTQDGSVVTFNDGQGSELFVRMMLKNGTRQTLINLAPHPPGQGLNLGPRFPNPLFLALQPVPRPAVTPPQAGDGGLASRQ